MTLALLNLNLCSRFYCSHKPNIGLIHMMDMELMHPHFKIVISFWCRFHCSLLLTKTDMCRWFCYRSYSESPGYWQKKQPNSPISIKCTYRCIILILCFSMLPYTFIVSVFQILIWSPLFLFVIMYFTRVCLPTNTGSFPSILLVLI